MVIYSSAIQYLLNNPRNLTAVGIQMAFNSAYDLASSSLNESIQVGYLPESFSALTFLNTAKALSSQCDQECPEHYTADFLLNNYSATAAPVNSLHHAFTLSFFWLL